MGKNLQQFHSSYVIVPRVQRCYGVIGDETTEAISVETEGFSCEPLRN